jgi:hypothetical protein
MKYATQEQAEAILKPYHPFFVEAMQYAFNEWKIYADRNPDTCARVRADIINDRICSRVKEKFPRTQLVDRPGSTLLLLGDIVCRFKKLTNSFPSNIPTQGVLRLENQEPNFGAIFDSATIVNVGYVPDKFWNKFKYEVSCIKGDRVIWSYIIPVDVITESVVEIPEEATLQQPKKKRIQIKKAK